MKAKRFTVEELLALELGFEVLERKRRGCGAGKHWYTDGKKRSRCALCGRSVNRLGKRRLGKASFRPGLVR